MATRTFPILIGIFEATSIDRRVKGFESPRPLTHDLLVSAVESLGGEFQDVVISELQRAHVLRHAPRAARGRAGRDRLAAERRDRGRRDLRSAAADLRLGRRAERRDGGAKLRGQGTGDRGQGFSEQVVTDPSAILHRQ